jgi:hypothetical protein
MTSNSAVYTTRIFGTGSGESQTTLVDRNTSTLEVVFERQGLTKMNNKIPRVPSNQGKAKDK